MSDSVEEVPFEIRTEHHPGQLRMCISGELDLYREGELRTAVADLLAGRPGTLVLDLRDVKFLDSSGLRALLACRNEARTRGAALLLSVTAGPVDRLLDVAGVHGWFDYE